MDIKSVTNEFDLLVTHQTQTSVPAVFLFNLVNGF
jgi:hypothetical protein